VKNGKRPAEINRLRPATVAGAPQHLKPETRAWYEKVASEYVLEEHHLRLLQLAGESWDSKQEARAGIARHGAVYTDRFGSPKARPEVAIERDCSIVFSRLLRELGLDIDQPGESRPPVIQGHAGARRSR
jgi:phage terminase small subunit